MRRTLAYIIILFLSAVATLHGQVSSIFGELRYRQQYYDLLAENLSISENKMSPQLSLGVAGYVFSPRILSLAVRSSATANYSKIQSTDLNGWMKQYLLNVYDVSVNALPGYIVSADYSSREYHVDTQADDALRARSGLLNYRENRQTATASIQRITSLPMVLIQYQKTRSWSGFQSVPFDQAASELSGSVSQTSGSASVNLTGQIVDQKYQGQDVSLSYKRLLFQGQKTYGTDHQLSLMSEYYSTGPVRNLFVTGSFNGFMEGVVRPFTRTYARQQQSDYSHSFLVGIDQGFHIVPDDHFGFNVSMIGETGRDIHYRLQDTTVVPVFTLSPNGGITHSRSIGVFHINNAVMGGYSHQKTYEESRVANASTTNGISFPFESVNISSSHTVSYARMTGFDQHELMTNTANVNLNLLLPYRITVQMLADYNDVRRMRTELYPYRRMQLRVNTTANLFIDLINPWNVGGGSIWYRYKYDLEGQTFGWNAYVNSERFFITNLRASYRFQRGYDLYLKRPVLEHVAELQYQWRAVSLQLRLVEQKISYRRRELWLDVVRPF